MALVLVSLCFLAISASCAEESEIIKSGEWSYHVLDDGSLMLDMYYGEMHGLAIPRFIDDKPVTAINGGGIPSSTVKSVTIHDAISQIVYNPFYACNTLNEIEVNPDNPYFTVIEGALVSKSDNRLICYPGGLSETKYEIPDGIKVIGQRAFSLSQVLKEVIIPESVEVIEDSAFYTSTQLESIMIPEGVQTIGANTFESCISLTKVVLPDSLCSIGDHAFFRCSALEEIVIPQNVEEIGDCAFSFCALSEVIVPEGVLRIGQQAFSSCSKLTRVVLPGTLKEIGMGAFRNCGIKEVVIPEGVTNIGDGAFFSRELDSVTVPDSVIEIGRSAFRGSDKMVVIVGRGSYAETYCKDNEIAFTYAN